MTIYDMYCAQEEVVLEREVMTVVDEVQRGISVFSNLLFIERFHQTHGLTRDFHELIGNENVVATIGATLKRFWEWIVENIHKLITALCEFFNRVVSRALQFFGISVKGNPTNTGLNSELSGILNPSDFGIPDDDLQIPYDLKRISLACEHFPQTILMNLNGDEDVPECIKERIDSYAILFEECGNRQYKRSEIRSVFSSLSDCLCHSVSYKKTLENNANDILHYIKHTPPSQIDVYKIMTMFSKGNNVIRYTSNRAFVKMCERFQNGMYSDQYVTDEIQRRIVALTMIETLSWGCKLLVGITAPIPAMIRNVGEIYNRNHAQIHMRYDLDPDLKRRIEEELGGTLHISNIYITSISPVSWPKAHPVSSVGAALCAGGTDRTGAVDIWVSARYLLKAKTTLFGKILDNRRSTLIAIVHECVHCYDSQHGVVFGPVYNPDTDYTKYKGSSHEDHADTVSENFVFIDSDYRWIDRIIADVRRAIGSKKI